MARPTWTTPLVILAAIAAAIVLATQAGAAPDGRLALQTIAPGAVIGLSGAPHLWVADDAGVLHWAGDTRGLAGHNVNWNSRRDVSLAELLGLSRGDPWLSAGLLKLGDPIYLVKWETSEAAPTLLHIQLLSDVELFGINAGNYGALVLDQAAWDQRYGMASASLPRGVLQAASGPTPTPTAAGTATPTLTPTPSRTMQARVMEVKRTGGAFYEMETSVEVTGAFPETVLKVSAQTVEYRCEEGFCDQAKSTDDRKWGPVTAGMADKTGRLVFIDRHTPYKSYTYTFEDPVGNKATLKVTDDLAPKST